MTMSVEKQPEYEVCVGQIGPHLITNYPQYLRVVIGATQEITVSPVQAVESHAAEAVIDVRLDGRMRFATNGNWRMWVQNGGLSREYKPDGVTLYDDVTGCAAMLFPAGFAGDDRWFLNALDGNLDEAPVVRITLTEKTSV